MVTTAYTCSINFLIYCLLKFFTFMLTHPPLIYNRYNGMMCCNQISKSLRRKKKEYKPKHNAGFFINSVLTHMNFLPQCNTIKAH